MKYRIVKTKSGDYRIQERILWFFWRFVVEPDVYYSEWHNGWVDGTGLSYLYDNKNDAEYAIEKLKEGSTIYKKYYIDLKRKGRGDYKYLICKSFFDSKYIECCDTLKEAKAHIDNLAENSEKKKNREKVDEVIKTY